ncbi:MAG: hypothetical protein RLZZ292_2286 [Bacteroidota bacterium]|jgi:hypothetical protein
MAVIKQDIDIANIFKYAVVAYGCYVVYTFIQKDKDKSPDKASSQAPPTPEGWKPGPNATLNVTEGFELGAKLKNEMNKYFATIDVQKIDKLLWVLKNDDDVDVLHKCFGTYDGPVWFDGDIFAMLNYLKNGFTVKTNGYTANWESIQRHMYSRGIYLNY